jgi:ElaB/YqjD/DUF883 family membrane-anchored ribosome-binding protein
MDLLMATVTKPLPDTPRHGDSGSSSDSEFDSPVGVDLRQIFGRLSQGLLQTIGLTSFGLALAALVYLLVSPFTTSVTSMRVEFAFEGYGKGEYPDHSKFQPDDLRAPDIVFEAMNRLGRPSTEELQGKIRGALTVEGIIPPNVTKERDRLRAIGQSAAPYLPDEYLITLNLPKKFSLDSRTRELLLNDIASAYQEKFQRTYGNTPVAFGNAFESLRNADFFEYELILNHEISSITTYLHQQLDTAKTFRSPTTNLSFSELLEQVELFSQIRLNETLGLIRQNGLSRNRAIAMVKMDYYLRTLEDQEQEAIEQEKVVDDLLSKAQDRSQNYVLGIKSQAVQQRSESPVLDQGLIDSLLANDAYSFLVHRALDAGLTVKRIQAEKAQLLERRKTMEEFMKSSGEDQSALIAEVNKSLVALESSYKELISNIRKTHSDYSKQEYADAIRISMQPVTDSKYKPLAIAGAVGGVIGLALGIGLSLTGIVFGRLKI